MDDAIDFTRMKRSGPPEDLWPAIAGELDRRGRHRFVRRLSALAATVAVVVLATALVEFPPAPSGSSSSEPVAATGEVTLAELQATSAALESRLADHRQRLVGGLEIESLMWLEAELAWLDEQLADTPADRELWRQRIQLLAELNRRYADGDWRRDMLLASV